MNETRYIDAFAEKIISDLSQDEAGKRQYYRPIYSIHKWWARRPGALFRSIVLHLCDSPTTHFETDERGSLSPESNYFKDHKLEDIVICDPFMGGGTTLVEANRLGAKVIGCDLNPVSYWIVKETLKTIDIDKLEKYFGYLEDSTQEKIKSLYQTTCPTCLSPADILYSFWLRFVNCPHCHQPVYLYKRTLLNQGLSRNKPLSKSNPATVFCPQCLHLNDWSGTEMCLCQSCETEFDPFMGSYDKGYFDCHHCGASKISLIKTLKDNQNIQETLLAHEYLCQCSNMRTYKSPDKNDFEKIYQIEQTFEETKENLVIPKQEILKGDSSARWESHNYRYYSEIFNARQILSFNYLIEGIHSIPEEEYRNAFITIFSNALEYNNMMTPYNYPHRKLHHLFNYHAMPLTTMPVENAVWGIGKEGAGTFVNCYRRYVKAKKYCEQPYDKFKDSQGTIQTIRSQQEKIGGKFVQSFAELKATSKSVFLLNGDSSNLNEIPSNSVNFVITDPPYFDSIHYSELSNFFYVWLRLLTNDKNFLPENVSTASEAIVNQGMAKGANEYQTLLTNVFQESARILKDSGKLIFTFHHTKWKAWWTVLQSLRNSGFSVLDSFPVMTEYKVNPHIRNKQALDMDLVLICQKQPSSKENLVPELSVILKRTMNRIGTGEISQNHNKIFLYYMGELLKTASVPSNSSVLNYEWFSDALEHFDEFIEKYEIAPLERRQEQTTESIQLNLFEFHPS